MIPRYLKVKSIAAGALLTLALAIPALAADTPQAALKAFFTAGAKGDVVTMQKLATGEVKKEVRRAELRGEMSVGKIKRLSAGYKGPRNLAVKGDKADGWAIFDLTKVLTPEQNKKLLAMVAMMRRAADKTRDGDKKKKLLATAADLEKGIMKIKVGLIKAKGQWLVSRLK